MPSFEVSTRKWNTGTPTDRPNDRYYVEVRYDVSLPVAAVHCLAWLRDVHNVCKAYVYVYE